MPPTNRPPMEDIPKNIQVTTKNPTTMMKTKRNDVVVTVTTPSKKVEKEIVSMAETMTSSSTTSGGSSSCNSSQNDEDTKLLNSKNPETDRLLEYATMRVQNERMKEELKVLKMILSQKDEHIVQLTGQLRRATTTKCDLVVACTDMERQMEQLERYGSPKGLYLRQQYLTMLEGRATMEREFMNELQVLTNELLATDRRYLNQLVDKDFTIGQLEEQVRRLSGRLAELELGGCGA
jgi:hypothetical protein